MSSSVREALTVRWIGVIFLLYEFSDSRVLNKPRREAPKVGDQVSQKSLASRTFIVQNGRTWS